MHGQHTHGNLATQPAATQGNLIRWASYYDPVVQILTFGQAASMRQQSADLAQIQPGQQVLDVGCGTGDLTIVAKQRAGSSGLVVGIDPAPEMIDTARQKATHLGVEINFRVGVIEALPFPEDSFDVVVSSLMMHHLPTALKEQGLAEIQRVLRPNGHLLIVDFISPTTFFSKILLKLLFHGGMQAGLTELSTQVGRAGFHDVMLGNLKLPQLGYISAYANKTA